MKSKRFLVLVGVALLSLCAGLLPSRSQATSLFESSAYFFILALFFLWLARVVHLYRAGAKERLRRHLPVLLLCILLTTLMFIGSPPRFKILADETNLLGVSMMMHHHRSSTLPLSGISAEYTNPDYATYTDKRPLLFPFLVSVVHSLRGYAPSNGFVLNFLVSSGILFLIYLTTARFLPAPYGWVAVLLAAGAPIYMINVTSSGFEALNLLFVLIFFFLLWEVYRSEGDIKRTELLLLTTLLLAQCRYESAAFVVAAAICLRPVLSKSGFLSRMSWRTCLMPVFLIPVLWQRKLFFGREELNKVGHERFEAADSLFSLEKLLANFDDNVLVLLGWNPHYGYTPLLSIAAVLGVCLLLKAFARKEPVKITPEIFAAALLSAILLFLIISSYFWGNFRLKMDNRLSLVFLPFLVWPAVFVLSRIAKPVRGRLPTVVAFAALIHLIVFWSFGSRQLIVHNLSLQAEYNQVLEFLEPRYPRNGTTLIIAEEPYLYLPQEYSGMRFDQSNEIVELLSGPNSVDHIIALQKIDKETGQIAQGSLLRGPFTLEPLSVFSISTELDMRISSCTLQAGGRRWKPEPGGFRPGR